MDLPLIFLVCLLLALGWRGALVLVRALVRAGTFVLLVFCWPVLVQLGAVAWHGMTEQVNVAQFLPAIVLVAVLSGFIFNIGWNKRGQFDREQAERALREKEVKARR